MEKEKYSRIRGTGSGIGGEGDQGNAVFDRIFSIGLPH